MIYIYCQVSQIVRFHKPRLHFIIHSPAFLPHNPFIQSSYYTFCPVPLPNLLLSRIYLIIYSDILQYGSSCKSLRHSLSYLSITSRIIPSHPFIDPIHSYHTHTSYTYTYCIPLLQRSIRPFIRFPTPFRLLWNCNSVTFTPKKSRIPFQKVTQCPIAWCYIFHTLHSRIRCLTLPFFSLHCQHDSLRSFFY